MSPSASTSAFTGSFGKTAAACIIELAFNIINSMAKATWNKAVLADSVKTEQVEENEYFPSDSMHREFFETSAHTTVCPWKGTAHYYHVVVNGNRNENAAWYYPEPKPAAANIKDHVAFWKGVTVDR